MKVIHTRKELTAWRNQQITTIGFVPTMGYLHDGHLTLVHEAKKENELVVMSIFVNKTQFGANEDFASYPRDLVRDIKLAEKAEVDVLFTPSDEEIYPDPLTSKIVVVQRVDVLDGKSRVGHFDGVALILMKLFNLVRTTRVYLGQKDAQQIAVIEGLVLDYFLPVQIRKVETVREEDGLAKSSRNVKLTVAERKEAAIIYQALIVGQKLIEQGETDKDKVLTAVKEKLGKQVTDRIDYLELYEYPSFKPVTDFNQQLILAISVIYSKARLIDNVVFSKAIK